MAGVVTAQRSVTSAQGFSVQPTTKLDGFTAVYSEFLLTASDHIPNDGKKVVGGIGEVKFRPGASALPVGWRVVAGATAWGCGLFIFAPRSIRRLSLAQGPFHRGAAFSYFRRPHDRR